jgi:O-antigen/teichoic acid export membrane protein
MLRQFSWVAIGRVVSALLQFITFVLLANRVDPGQFGIIAAVVGAAIVPQSFLDFGMATYIVKARSADRNDGVVTYALKVNNRISLAFSAIALAVLVLLGVFVDPTFASISPLAVWAAGEKNADTWLGVALADGDSHLNLVGLIGRRLAAVTLLIIGFSLDFEPGLIYACAMAIAALSAAAFAQIVVGRRLPPQSAGSLRGLLRRSRPYWLHSFATQLRNLDSALVAMVGAPTQAGYYAVASRISGPLRLVPTSLASVLLPVVAREGRVAPKTRKLIALTLLAMGVTYALFAVAAPFVIPALMGSAYDKSVIPVQAMCFGLIFGAAASMFAAILQGFGEQKYVAVCSVVSSLTCIPAIVLGTLWLGATGAAMGMISSFLLQSVLFVFKLVQHRRKRRGRRRAGR